MLDHVKESKWFLIIFAVVAGVGVQILLLKLLITLSIGPFLRDVTGGLVHPNLVVGALTSLFVIGGIVLWLGQLRPKDIGLSWAKLRAGVLVLLGMWMVVQVGVLVDALVTNEVRGPQVQVIDTTQVGYFLVHLVLAGFLEETLYRGFLLPQFYLRLKRLGTQESHWLPVAGAVLGSSILFGGVHLIKVFFYDVTLVSLLPHAGVGIIFGIGAALVYLRTENLFFSIGLHALFNFPLSLIGGSYNLPRFYVIIVAIAILIFWPHMVGKKPSRAKKDTGQIMMVG